MLLLWVVTNFFQLLYIYIYIYVAEIIRVLGGRRQRGLEILGMVFLEEQEEGAQSLGKKTSFAKGRGRGGAPRPGHDRSLADAQLWNVQNRRHSYT